MKPVNHWSQWMYWFMHQTSLIKVIKLRKITSQWHFCQHQNQNNTSVLLTLHSAKNNWNNNKENRRKFCEKVKFDMEFLSLIISIKVVWCINWNIHRDQWKNGFIFEFWEVSVAVVKKFTWGGKYHEELATLDKNHFEIGYPVEHVISTYFFFFYSHIYWVIKVVLDKSLLIQSVNLSPAYLILIS